MTETIEVTVSSDAQRKASAVYFKKREQAGLKRATFWLTPTARATLDRLSDRFGSKDATIEEALTRLSRDLEGRS